MSERSNQRDAGGLRSQGGALPGEQPPPLTDVGPYRLIKTLGQGGMGVVFQACHRESGKLVALKTLQTPEQELVQRLRTEIRGLSNLRHPGIVKIFDEGMCQGVPWYAMELLEGLSLRHYLQQRRVSHVPPQKAAQAFPSGKERTRRDTLVLEGPVTSEKTPVFSRPNWWTGALPAGGRSSSHPLGNQLSKGRPLRWRAELEEDSSSQKGFAAQNESLPQSQHPLMRLQGEDSRKSALRLIYRLCVPLAFLHSKGLVHRDLKPENILIQGHLQPVLIDFGLLSQWSFGHSARSLLLSRRGKPRAQELLNVDVAVAGSIHYMAPEQLQGERVDARADLYALGCLLYELLTGFHPFEGSTAQAVIRGHLLTPPRPPSELMEAGLESDLEELILRLLKKKPSERIGYAEDVARILARHGAAEGESFPRYQPYLYYPGFSGRQKSVELLQERLGLLQEGKGGLLLLHGESGMGKTRLLSELGKEARKAEVQVLVGECSSQEARPLRSWLDPLQSVLDHCLERGPEVTREILEDRVELLSAYLPALANLPGLEASKQKIPIEPGAARRRLFSDLTELWLSLASQSPILLLLDDLQWADELSLEFLSSFCQRNRLESRPVLVVGAFRSEEITPRLQELLDSLDCQELSLERIGKDAITQVVCDALAQEEPSWSFVQFLTEASLGNPFFVAEYLRVALSEGILQRDPLGQWQIQGKQGEGSISYKDLPFPNSLRQLVERRLRLLSPKALRLSQAASVVGREVELGFLESLVKLPGEQFQSAHEELLQRHICMNKLSSEHFRFVHDQLREAAYASLENADRKALHQEVAKLLVERFGLQRGMAEESTLAEHWNRAGRAEHARNSYLAAARQAVGAYAYADAQRFYQASLSQGEQPPDQELWVWLELARDVYGRQAEYEQVLACSCMALKRALEGRDLAGQGASLQQFGYGLLRQGKLSAAQDKYERALEFHRATGRRQAEGDTLDNLAITSWNQGELSRSLQQSWQALVIHAEVGNLLSKGNTLNNIAGVYWQMKDLRQARKHGEQALEIFRQIGNFMHEGACQSNLAQLSIEGGEPLLARKQYQQALALHRKVGDRFAEVHSLLMLASLERRLFNFAEAGNKLLQAKALALQVDSHILSIQCFCEQGFLTLAEGHSAENCLASAEELVESSGLGAGNSVVQELQRLRATQRLMAQGGELLGGEKPEDWPPAFVDWLQRQA